MILFLDLDGTLTDTEHPHFKEVKDGLVDADISKIPLINGAKEFIEAQKIRGNLPIIVSDSHPKYVNKIASEVFKIDCNALTDKPNPQRTLSFIVQRLFENEAFLRL
jgi:hypothetical protein